jgi:protein-S-isoprenylcysteine O-methyltransferase Ste14
MVCVGGLFVALWARKTLAGNWSSTVTFKKGHELVKTGPYRFTRHPIYTGLLLMGLGVTVEIGRLRCWLGLLAWVLTRSRLGDQPGGATRRAARPEKTDGSARGSWGLEL